MDMARFMELMDDFAQFPPLFEVARTQVLLPGDKGYPKQKSNSRPSAHNVDQLVKPSGKEPDWLRNARLKRERTKNGAAHDGQ